VYLIDPQAILIEPMNGNDWEAVRAIYLQGIETRNATFETAVPPWEKWDANHLKVCRFVAREAGRTVGWAALSPVSSRAVYAGVAEVSVYVAEQAHGRGVGKKLLGKLVEASEREGIWTLQAGILVENKVSIEMHKRCGFRVVGTREKLGCLDGRWRDVCLMERRSAIVGQPSKPFAGFSTLPRAIPPNHG
jgi:L-amino acid N-acyltransferase YncA